MKIALKKQLCNDSIPVTYSLEISIFINQLNTLNRFIGLLILKNEYNFN